MMMLFYWWCCIRLYDYTIDYWPWRYFHFFAGTLQWNTQVFGWL